MTDQHCHVHPEPAEAPKVSPTTAEDLIRYRAVLHAWNWLRARTQGPVSFPVFLAAVDEYERHRDEASLERQYGGER